MKLEGPKATPMQHTMPSDGAEGCPKASSLRANPVQRCEIDPSEVEASKRRISEYFVPTPPPQEDCLGSGLIGLMDYFLYEGADVRNLLYDFAIVLADSLAGRNPNQ